MLKLVLRRILHSLRNVAPKSQHIFNAFFFQLPDHFPHFCFRRRDAGQVSKAWHLQIILNMGCDTHRILACAAACTVSNTDEGRSDSGDLIHRFQDALIFVIRLRWKHLKGNMYFS